MTTAHDVPEAIQWSEGMLLRPHHFQQATLRQESLLHYHALLMSPFHWGVRHLKIDDVLLADGSFRVLELEAVMPDGLSVSYPSSQTSDLTFDLKPHAEEMKEKRLVIHLAVAALRPDLAVLSGDLARYDSAEGKTVIDANTGEGETRVPRLRPKLHLLAGDEPPQKFVSFPLARVVYRSEAFALERYVPPTLRVARSSHLGELLAAVAKELREKAVQLSEEVRSPTGAARRPQMFEKVHQIHSLVGALPQFEVLLSTGVSHPFVLYQSLATVLGHTAALGHSLVPSALASYDHEDLWVLFEHACKAIHKVVREGVKRAYEGFPFYLEEGAFLRELEPDWRDRELLLGVRGRDQVSEEATIRWIEQSLIGSKRNMSWMLAKRVRGAGRSPVSGPVDLVPASGVTLFSLVNDPEFIAPGELLEIRNLDEPDGHRRPVEIVLYLRNRG